MSATPRTVNAVFAFRLDPQQQHRGRRPISRSAINPGGGLHLPPGRGEMMAPSSVSGNELGCRAATAAASTAGGVSGGVKRSLGHACVMNDAEHGGPPTVKRRHKRENRDTHVSGAAAAAAAAAAVVNRNNSNNNTNRNYSPTLLGAHMSPQPQASRHRHQHQHQPQPAPEGTGARAEDDYPPCKAISETGRHGEARKSWDGEGGNLEGVGGGGKEDSWDRRPSSPSMTLWSLDEAGSSPPPPSLSSSSSSPVDGAAITPICERLEGGISTTTSGPLRQRRGSCSTSLWSGSNRGGGVLNSVSIAGPRTNTSINPTATVDDMNSTNSTTNFNTATGKLKEQQQHPAQRPATDPMSYAQETLNAALLDEENKCVAWEAIKPAESAARQRRLTATASKWRVHARVKACWSQCLKPAHQEVVRLTGKWTDLRNDRVAAEESTRRTREVQRKVEQLFRQAQDRAVRARVLHENAVSALTFPRIDCDYGALLAAEQATREAEHVSRCSLENARTKMEEVREAVKLAADHADVESIKSVFLNDWLSTAKSRYEEARVTFNTLKAQLEVAVAEERAAIAAERKALEPRNQHKAAKLRSKRVRDTFDLFAASRVKDKSPAATEGGGVTTSASSAGACGATTTRPAATATTVAVRKVQRGAGGGESSGAQEDVSSGISSASGTKRGASVMGEPGDEGEDGRRQPNKRMRPGGVK